MIERVVMDIFLFPCSPLILLYLYTRRGNQRLEKQIGSNSLQKTQT